MLPSTISDKVLSHISDDPSFWDIVTYFTADLLDSSPFSNALCRSTDDIEIKLFGDTVSNISDDSDLSDNQRLNMWYQALVKCPIFLKHLKPQFRNIQLKRRPK
jgi:hypothetical protein